ncbi:serum opacification factor [Streptococcus pyogenes]|uniref:serum opacification factor n=1 Tax=Streptococcus pyogenes TaxID=1314 RepID=UPI00050CE0CD|nr:serum opacification factor [Streptococcus pyogenes]UEN85218.1 fibronectin binding protein [Streptococcus pyogenes]VGQ98058.1 Serum opacity factor [Streptococcus pyogenes]VGS52811.1 Serum opacity factor [Streptococcus pyogenes]VGS55865.1 Serum opacity factor [Streptococcus pyogenes]VGS87781.1 Serum opacity factor [Streptococcus pyogenes]
MTNCKYKLRKLSVGLVSVGTMLIAPTALGQEVSTNTNTSTASAGTTANGTADTIPNATTDAGGAAGSGTNGASSVTSSGGSQSSESAQASPQAQTATVASASTTASPSSASASDVKAPRAATSSTPSTPAASTSSNSNQVTGTEAEPQMMDVEQYTVDKKDSSVTQTDNKKLLKIRRDGKEKEDRTLYDIKREVKDNGDGTLDVTLKVTPKQIDEGADVMALLDVSKKMTDADFKNAKEKIKKLVTTLTSKSDDGKENLNNRNTVRLMTFYRKISEPIDLSGKTSGEVEDELNKIWNKVKKEDWDWGVDLQGAIHKARDIFKKEKESKKRQHIVLFSQGESTFSYDIKDKSDNKVAKTRITEKVTTSNPLLPWPPIFNHTNQNTDMLDDFAKLVTKLKSLGLGSLETADSILKALRTTSQFGSIWGKSLTEYLTLYEYDSDKLDEKSFDYAKHVGEGYYYHSFSERTHEDTMPLETAIKTALTSYFPQFPTNWFSGILNSFVEKDKVEKVKLDVIMQVLRSIFYKREYRYYNHNRSAIAEAKMAQKDGITFYSVDVTSPNQSANKRIRRSAATPEEKRNEKFDNYLKQMSEGGREFFTDVDKADKFKDTLTELTIKDEFADKVTVQKDSKGKEYHKTSLSETPTVNHTAAATIKSFFSNSTTKESLTWTISKEQLKKAFEDGKPLTLTYKLKVDNNKFKTALDSKKRTKRDTPTENENSVTEKIISNTITYTINNQKGQTDKKLDEVSLTYSKFKVPVPQIDGQVIEPQAPKLPDLPPVIERGPVLDYTEESIYRLPLEHGSNAPDTQVTIEEDTVPQRPDILVGGQSGPVDITEDTQPGMSGSNDATVIEEDTAPKRPDVLVGGQSDPIDITEDTQPSVSGSNDATVVEEDTVPKRPDILVGGQSDPIDITEDTQPGMSGSNDATVIEEDTKPKRFFHFDNEPQAPEKPKEQPSLSLPQAPVYKAAHHLPASGDKREASFTIAALTIIGAAGLLSKKRRDTEEN